MLPWPVELGPEFIHGANTSLMVCSLPAEVASVLKKHKANPHKLPRPISGAMQGILEDMGCKFKEYEWPDCWYFKADRRLKAADEEV